MDRVRDEVRIVASILVVLWLALTLFFWAMELAGDESLTLVDVLLMQFQFLKLMARRIW